MQGHLKKTRMHLGLEDRVKMTAAHQSFEDSTKWAQSHMLLSPLDGIAEQQIRFRDFDVLGDLLPMSSLTCSVGSTRSWAVGKHRPGFAG